VSFRWQIVLHQVANLGFIHFIRQHFSNSYLNSVDSVLLKCLYLSDLGTINLYHSAWGQFAPLIPEMCHSNLVAKQADSLGQTVNWRRRLYGKVFVYFFFKRLKSFSLVCNAVLLGVKNFIVV